MSDRAENPTTPSKADTRPAPRVLLFQSGDLLCNRFRVVRFIARGGMGELYEAEDSALGERVALKTTRPEIARDERASQRFRREVQLARKVTHANICRIFDLFEHVPEPGADEAGPPAAVFVTMELLHGETLSQRLSRTGPFSTADALPIIRQMAAALAAAHAAGIVHRDFKSNNVMLMTGAGSQPLRVVVTDFGLAHRVSDDGRMDSSITATGDFVGTPDYMAPEQIEGAELTPATDIYALGIVIYEMMTGRRPFAAETPLASALKRLTGPPPLSPRELAPDLPVAWDRAIMRCLSRRPDERFPDAMSVADAFSASATDAPSTRTSDTLVPALGVALLLIAALVALVGGARWWRLPSAPPARATGSVEAARPSVAVLGFRNLAGREDVRWLSTALSEMLTTELGAAERVRTVPGENVTRMKTELALADADAFTAETLARIRTNLGVDYVVSGSYVTVGEGAGATLRVDIRIQDSQRGQTTALVSETGRSAELLDVVSRAGGKLRDRLGVGGPSSVASVRASQPGSSDAARFYAEGLIRLRQFDALGARTLFEEAIQADPAFPLAYSALATTWSALGYDGKAKDAAARAFKLSATLPRTDRLLVEGTYHEMSSGWKEAIGIWQSLATYFPDDVEYALRLANAQITSGAPKDGLATIEGFRTRFPAVADPRLSLAEAQAAETLSDFTRMQTAAAAAGAAGKAQRAVLLVASARLREGDAALRAGHTDRAVTLLTEARNTYAEAGDRVGVARTLNSLATAISDGKDAKGARALYDEGLALARAVGKQDLVARFLNNIAIQERRAGNLQAALKMNEEALAIRREIGDRTNTAVSLNNIGNVLLDLGDLQGASRHYQESADMSREIGDRRGTARALYNAGESLRLQGDLTRSRATYDESLAIRRGISDPAGVATSLFGVGQLAFMQGDLAAARQSINEALEMDRRLDRRRPIAFETYLLAEMSFVEGDLAGARKRHQEALDMRTALGEAGTAAESRTALALLDLEEGKPAEAEARAREAAEVFAAQNAPGNEAAARAALALALLAQGRPDQAAREIGRAQTLVQNPQHVLYRFPVSIAAARVTADSTPAAALRSLKGILDDATKRGLPRYAFEARRAMAAIEGARSAAAGQQVLADLKRDAKARGFGLYAR